MPMTMCELVRGRSIVLWMTLVLLRPVAVVGEKNCQRESIGQVLGKPVYRDQIRTGKDLGLDDELHRLFTLPVREKYCREHKAEVTPTDEEIAWTADYFDRKHREEIKDKEPKLKERLKSIQSQLSRTDLSEKQREDLEFEKLTIELKLRPLGKEFAQFMLDHWKFERYLYEKYGGGRILWQQAGQEAFDAMRVWLETQERKGLFQITDAKLREEFYRYWNRSHGAFLTDDKDDIREEFLQPEWVKPKP